VRQRRYAKNKIELAAAVGLSYRRLLDYFRDPNHPEDHSPGKARYDIAAWSRFIASRATAHNRGSRNGQYPISEREQLIIQRNRIAIEREKFKLGVAKHEYLARDEVNRAIGTANAAVRREIDRAISVELPPRLEGLSAMEIKKILWQKFDAIFVSLPKRFANAYGDTD
jgi:hypothetical protein